MEDLDVESEYSELQPDCGSACPEELCWVQTDGPFGQRRASVWIWDSSQYGYSAVSYGSIVLYHSSGSWSQTLQGSVAYPMPETVQGTFSMSPSFNDLAGGLKAIVDLAGSGPTLACGVVARVP